ncbi:MAG: hypothetical protein FJW40_03380 [Acidobacteria bacterium]|nr:hypothetical protein [Acidobacteriota bacterium]
MWVSSKSAPICFSNRARSPALNTSPKSAGGGTGFGGAAARGFTGFGGSTGAGGGTVAGAGARGAGGGAATTGFFFQHPLASSAAISNTKDCHLGRMS